MITADTANQLEALALQIFNPNIQPNPPGQEGLGWHFDPAFYTGIKGQNDSIDAKYFTLIAPVMSEIDGRTMATGMKYTMNITNALQGRPKHWFLQGVNEFQPSVLPPCHVAFAYLAPQGQPGLYGDFGSYGFSLGTAMCAGICSIWAQIVRMYLAGDYPWAVNQP